MKKTTRNTIIALFVVTLLLGIVAVIIGVRLSSSEDTTLVPTASFACANPGELNCGSRGEECVPNSDCSNGFACRCNESGADGGDGVTCVADCGPIECNDGTTFGADSCSPQNCDARATQACAPHGGPKTTGAPPDSSACQSLCAANQCEPTCVFVEGSGCADASSCGFGQDGCNSDWWVCNGRRGDGCNESTGGVKYDDNPENLTNVDLTCTTVQFDRVCSNGGTDAEVYFYNETGNRLSQSEANAQAPNSGKTADEIIDEFVAGCNSDPVVCSNLTASSLTYETGDQINLSVTGTGDISEYKFYYTNTGNSYCSLPIGNDSALNWVQFTNTDNTAVLDTSSITEDSITVVVNIIGVGGDVSTGNPGGVCGLTNATPAPSCNITITKEEEVELVCGDGILGPDEECDPAITNSCGGGAVCLPTCVCEPTEPGLCGSACTTNNECPTGHSCSDGTCKLDECIDPAGLPTGGPGQAICTNNGCQIVECGSTCGPNRTCPTGLACNSDNICIASYCLNNECENLCQIPATDFISEEVDLAMVAILMVLVGILVYKLEPRVMYASYLSRKRNNKLDKEFESNKSFEDSF